MTSCIILAGGLSIRFPEGKLTYKIKDNTTLIEAVTKALEDSGSCSEILVVASIHTMQSIRPLMRDISLVRDEESLPCKGPMRGIATGAIYSSYRELLTVPGDAGWLKPEAVRLLKAYSHRLEASIATPLWGDGYMPMLFTHIRDTGETNPLDQCTIRGSKSRPSDLFRASRRLALVGSKLLGDDGLTFKTINKPEDLLSPKLHTPSDRLALVAEHSKHFIKASNSDALGLPATALLSYLEEYQIYEKQGIRHLAIHAIQDACRAAREAGEVAITSKLSRMLAVMRPGRRHGRIIC